MKKGTVGGIMALAFIIIIVIVVFNSASVKRSIKSVESNLNNGMDRTITVYDYSGKEIKHWTGKFDVTESETGIMFDDQDGRRTIITNGIIINEETR